MGRKYNKHNYPKSSHNTSKYKELLKNNDTIAKSSLYSEVYDKLLKEGRLKRFIATVQYCSIKNYDLDSTVELLKKSFPNFINEFDKETFLAMMNYHSDIAVAWGYGVLGDEISNIVIKNKALEIIEKTNNMEDIELYMNLFNKVDSVDTKTVVNFNLNRV